MFDNAAGVGHKGYGEREPRLTHLFQAFQAHYGFDCSFCNPYSGHEKGAVESKASTWCGASCCIRPSVWSLENFNAGSGPVPGAGHETALPQGHGGTWPVLRGPCGAAAVAGKRFDVVTWRHMKADRYGVVTLKGRHRYSASRANAGRGVIVGLRALEVEVLDSSGKHLATHPRAYGQASTNSEDPSMQLALLCNKPASWPNSRVRDALPDPLREWLDRQDRQEHATRRCRPSNALTGNPGGRTRSRRCFPSSNRPAGRTAPVSHCSRPGSPRAWRVSNTTMTGRILSRYDIAFTADVGVQEGGR